jgi:hypothetical protein
MTLSAMNIPLVVREIHGAQVLDFSLHLAFTNFAKGIASTFFPNV